jgi:phenylacetate-CoA ligase
MQLFASLRSLVRIAFGRRPLRGDLDRMVDDMRRRLIAGKVIRPPKASRLPPGFARRRLRAFQLRKLKRTVAYVYKHVPHYRRVLDAAGIRPGDIRSLADLRRLPITERAEVDQGGDDFISRAPGLAGGVLLPSSGTTSRPLETYLTFEEFDYYTSLQAMSGMMYGFLGPAHIVQVHLPYDMSIATKILTMGALKTGALVLNLGLAGALDKHLDSLLEKRTVPGKFSQVSSLFGAPGYLWALAARSRSRGLRPEQFGLKNVSTGGAKVSPELRALVLAAWGRPLREAYSLAETVSTGAYSCDHGRLHFLDFSGLVEFLDPETRQPVPPGTPGVAVFTTFYPDRELMPVLRYWTRDLVLPAREEFCPCGLVTTAIDSVLGRTDQMITVGGQNYYPQPVGDALGAFPELVQPARFRIRTEERPDAEYALVEIECAAGLDAAAREQLRTKIAAALPLFQAVHVTADVVKVELHFVPAGSIATPFRYKLQGPAPVI